MVSVCVDEASSLLPPQAANIADKQPVTTNLLEFVIALYTKRKSIRHHAASRVVLPILQHVGTLPANSIATSR
jgi:hypothetical protein